MSEQDHSGILRDAAAQVLETMFFTSILGERDAPPENPAVDARVSFRGAPSGRFGVRLSGDAARSIAGNFLGAEDESELTAAQIDEVVCEMANMICGAVLSRIESDSSFDIAKPELAPAGGALMQSFELDNGALMVSLTLDKD